MIELISRPLAAITLVLTFISVAACSSDSSRAAAAPDAGGGAPASFILVHGAWNGAWVWDDVAAGLTAAGAKVTTVELPAHGADNTPLGGATLDAYVAKVGAAIDAAGVPVVLVGHSLGGMVITEAAEQKPDKISKLVYLAGYLPKDGQSLQALSAMDAASHVGPAIKIDPMAGTAAIPKDKLLDIFCADCSAAAMTKLTAHYRDEPLAAFGAPVHVTAAGWGRVAKYYVFTQQDHAISPAFQQTMTSGVTFAATASLNTGHAPFLAQPALVVSTLLGF